MTAPADVSAPVRMLNRIGPGTVRDDLWEMYYDAFTEINRLAVQRHRMHYGEFCEVIGDARVEKYLSFGVGGQINGLALLTNDLPAWPLVSPEYFEHRWPDHYRDHRIFYVGFVCAAEGAPVSVFPDLIHAMYWPVGEVDGIAVMDFSTVNVARRLPQVTHRILSRWIAPDDPEVVSGPLDSQTFFGYRFDGRPL